MQTLEPHVVTVARRRRELSDTYTLEFDVSDRFDGFRFTPGQFNMLYAFGVGEVPISISGDESKPGRLVHTIRDVGLVTRALCGMRKGHSVGVRGPFGTGWPMQAARGRDVLVVAGGLGLAPVRPVLYAAANSPGSFGRVSLCYGARTPQDILYHSELLRWRARSAFDVRITVDSAPRGWGEHAGVVTTLLGSAPVDPRSAIAIVCGPDIMMRFCARELLARGFGADRVFLSLERNMQCAVGHCGRCQYGPHFLCKNGPVLSLDAVGPFLEHREV